MRDADFVLKPGGPTRPCGIVGVVRQSLQPVAAIHDPGARPLVGRLSCWGRL